MHSPVHGKKHLLLLKPAGAEATDIALMMLLVLDTHEALPIVLLGENEASSTEWLFENSCRLKHVAHFISASSCRNNSLLFPEEVS